MVEELKTANCPASPRKSHFPEDNSHGKRSVISKLKEKVRRWKNARPFTKKHGCGEGDEVAALSPPGLNQREKGVEEEDDREFIGAPMYKSLRGSPRKAGAPSPRAPWGSTAGSSISTGELMAVTKTSEEGSRASLNKLEKPLDPAPAIAAWTPTQTVKEFLTPLYNMLSTATQAIASKIHGPPNAAAAQDEIMAKVDCDKKPAEAADIWAKSEAVKDHLMSKLHPGEEDRALSEVITEVMSPKKAGEERDQGLAVSLAGKIKGAFSSIIGERKNLTAGFPVQDLKLSNDKLKTGTPAMAVPGRASIPISTNPRPGKLNVRPKNITWKLN
ncbi:hypothetical protein HPP92_015541 [Vanilla planifolia]|uniref:LTI65/LTI78 PGEED repeat domain-containing protein n=1 Tax=Vanilla planifolia TaxID=51239 RepID=A0A835QPQ1_VANPL|nr:hypothetical protein HPP92_015541 [Vanilla planifolia]